MKVHSLIDNKKIVLTPSKVWKIEVFILNSDSRELSRFFIVNNDEGLTTDLQKHLYVNLKSQILLPKTWPGPNRSFLKISAIFELLIHTQTDRQTKKTNKESGLPKNSMVYHCEIIKFLLLSHLLKVESKGKKQDFWFAKVYNKVENVWGVYCTWLHCTEANF